MLGFVEAQKHFLKNIVHLLGVENPLAHVMEDEGADFHKKTLVSHPIALLGLLHQTGPGLPLVVFKVQGPKLLNHQ